MHRKRRTPLCIGKGGQHQKSWTGFASSCDTSKSNTPHLPPAPRGMRQRCAAALGRMAGELGGYYTYALYDECFYENDFLAVPAPRTPRWAAAVFPPTPAGRERGAGRGARRGVGERTPGYACGGDGALAAWVATAEVRTAMMMILMIIIYIIGLITKIHMIDKYQAKCGRPPCAHMVLCWHARTICWHARHARMASMVLCWHAWFEPLRARMG